MGATLAQIRAGIKTTLDAAVADVANTHDYYRDPKTDTEFDAAFIFANSGKLHCWMISRDGAQGFQTTNARWMPGREANSEFGLTKWYLYGYFAHDDATATEKAWDDVVEGVFNTFRQDKKLNDSVINSGPLQWTEGGGVDRMATINGILCHYAKLELVVRVQLEP